MPTHSSDVVVPKDLLDADELLQLASQAAESNRTEQALSFLKRALILRPDDARLHYMLGAQHAQLGLYDRALGEMQQAIRLDASLHTAHFQIGLLHMTSGRMDDARNAWQPLDKLPEQDALRLFKTALEYLAVDAFDEFARCVQEGIQANRSNAPLNEDMKRLLVHVQAQRAATAQPADGDTVSPAAATQHVLLNAYRRQ